MSIISRWRWRSRVILALTLALVFALSTTLLAFAGGLKQISSDPFTNKTSQHMTELEPDTFAFGNTIVSAFQVGRFYNGGASDIGFATSTDGGATFTHGFLPGVTVFKGGGKYGRASDASVAYDARHKVWMISSLGLFPNGNTAVVDVLVSRSTDGGLTWGNPVAVNATSEFNDKNWTACDDTSTSPFYGNCYTEFDNASVGDQIQMSTSTDGGKTWGAAKGTGNSDFGIGGQPLVQPSGTVVVPIIGFVNDNSQPFKMISFISTTGGASWSSTVNISEMDYHLPSANLRATIPLPSAEIDAAGTVYVVWGDCRFEDGCNHNDIVLSTSSDGLHWSKPGLVPIDPVGGSVDHFIPGLAVDRTTSGGSAHLGLAFYYYPVSNCQVLTCALTVGFISSTDGGATWSAKERLSPAMALSWTAQTSQGFMVGDYISTSIIPGDNDATPVFAVATPPSHVPPQGGTCLSQGVICHESTFTTNEDLLQLTGGPIPLGNGPVFTPPNRPMPLTMTAY
jgi:BNR repeat-like domain